MENAIRSKKVIIGGIITGMLLNMVDAPNGIFIAGPRITEFLLAHGITPNPLVPAYFFPFHLLYGMMIVWTYASFLPKYGKGWKNALLATFLLLLTTRFMAFGFVVMGLLPLNLFLILSATMVIGSTLGGLVGCWYYSRA
ncbi:MAG: hypothetical protein KGS48_14395 [Bacteroidetes bacterium]|nr:hypothetical protein [Bacteroidota bacterium]